MLENNNLSIAIPIYNGARHIEKTLDVLLKQKNFDLVISDNNSTDDTKKILKNYSKKYKNITINYNSENIGFDLNLRKCVKLCKTEYVWLLTDDDLIRHDAVEIVNSIIRDKGLKQKLSIIFVDNLYEYSGLDKSKSSSDPNKFFEYTKFRSGGMSSNIINRDIWNKISFQDYPDYWPHLVYSIIALNYAGFYIYVDSLKSEIDPDMTKRLLNNLSLFSYLISLKKTYNIMREFKTYSKETIKGTKVVISKHIKTAIIIEKKNHRRLSLNNIYFSIINSRQDFMMNVLLLMCPSFLYDFFKNLYKQNFKLFRIFDKKK